MYGALDISVSGLIAQRTDQLRLVADDTLHSREFRDLECTRLKKTGADDRISLAQWFEHGRGSACGVIFAGQKDRLDAKSLARLDGANHFDELVASRIPGDNRPLRPQHVGQFGRLLRHQLLLVLGRPFRA